MIDFLDASGVTVLGMLLSILLVGATLQLVIKYGGRSDVRKDVPASHAAKAGTPSMGGIGIMAAIVVSGVIAAAVTDQGGGAIALVICCAALFALIGFADDYFKLLSSGSTGMLARYRIILELALGLLFAWMLATSVTDTPIVSGLGFGTLPMGLRVLLGAFVIAGSANAVNLTDGLDGLAGGASAIAALALAAVCWATGATGLALVSLVVAGCAAGFIWFNFKPAQIWMGDVGSLALGAILGAIAVAGSVELVYGIVGMVFVVETVSVILQVLYFRTSGGRRLFPMTPIHHSFELMEWPETRIVTRFWLCGAVAGLLGILIAAAVVGH